jgi:hypothetical protein
LPAEIRSRIYGYVLGGKIIHIRKPLELGDGPVVCVHPTALPFRDRLVENGVVKKPARIKKTSHLALGYDVPHRKCHERLEQFSLGLLGVCRQIYHEAVLVPFTDNVFIDDVRAGGRPHLRIFLDRLVPIQVKSINHLVLNTTHMSLHCVSDLNRLSGLKTLEYNLVHHNLQYTTRQDFVDLYEKDFKILHPAKLRLPELTHLSVKAMDWQHRTSAWNHELEQVKRWFSHVISERQELRLAHNRAGVTRRKAQQFRKLAHLCAVTPHMIQYASKIKHGTFSSRRELHDITIWVGGVETRMLNALRLPPRESNASMAA